MAYGQNIYTFTNKRDDFQKAKTLGKLMCQSQVVVVVVFFCCYVSSYISFCINISFFSSIYTSHTYIK